MSLDKILEEYVEKRNIIETKYKDMILQYNVKYKELNIYAPNGIDVKEFIEIRNRTKENNPEVKVVVNQ